MEANSSPTHWLSPSTSHIPLPTDSQPPLTTHIIKRKRKKNQTHKKVSPKYPVFFFKSNNPFLHNSTTHGEQLPLLVASHQQECLPRTLTFLNQHDNNNDPATSSHQPWFSPTCGRDNSSLLQPLVDLKIFIRRF